MTGATQFIEQFHWLRPLWLLGLLPALAMALLLWKQTKTARHWRQLIAPELLGYLVDDDSSRAGRFAVWGLLAAWCIACLGLAGPSWEKRPMPVHLSDDALVIALDLSPSMVAEDVSSSRLAVARMKIADLLDHREEGVTGLVAYAGSAHLVAPLTDDVSTIRNLTPALHPNMMPLPGSQVEAALEASIDLLEQGGASNGRVLLVTDGVAKNALPELLSQIESSDIQLSILGVGTAEGAPIPDQSGGFERDSQGKVRVARLPEARLQDLAKQGDGLYQRVTRSNRDIQQLTSQTAPASDTLRELQRTFNTWYDRGHWLSLLLLPLALYAFRPGVLLLVVAFPLLALSPNTSQAQGLSSLWLNPDQRGQKLLQEDKPDEAAQTFKNPQWRGSAHYRAGNYEAAAQAFSQADSPEAHYNRGNALARSGELEAALKAYDQALKKSPNMTDAAANRKLVKQLLDQQQEQQQKSDAQNPQGDQSKSDPSSQNSKGDPSKSPGSERPPQNTPRDKSSKDKPNDQGEQRPSDTEQREEQNEAEPQSAQGNQADDEATNEDQTEVTEPGKPQGKRDENPQTTGATSDKELSDEERQALEQWLRRVPDDPSGLLRRKFEFQAQQQRRERLRRNARPDNNQRW